MQQLEKGSSSSTPDVKSCVAEALAAVREVAFAVKSIQLSAKLPADGSEAYLNIVTLEDESMCVRIGEEGFRIVSAKPDFTDDQPSSTCYETVYSLLSETSEGFRAAFSQALSAKLLSLTDVDEA